MGWYLRSKKFHYPDDWDELPPPFPWEEGELYWRDDDDDDEFEDVDDNFFYDDEMFLADLLGESDYRSKSRRRRSRDQPDQGIQDRVFRT